MSLTKLDYNDALMLENLVETINELIEENEYLHKRIDHLWKFIRVKDKKGKKEKAE
jgi:hypothetical protein